MENVDEENIEIIHGPLDISIEPFGLEEYRIVKTSIKEGKACYVARISNLVDRSTKISKKENQQPCVYLVLTTACS